MTTTGSERDTDIQTWTPTWLREVGTPQSQHATVAAMSHVHASWIIYARTANTTRKETESVNVIATQLISMLATLLH